MIGGNVSAVLQKKTSSKNSYGGLVNEWEQATIIKGFLDYVSGDSSYKSNYKGAVAETTHIFICDYVKIDVINKEYRLVVDNNIYTVLMIDDPMGLHQHLEIMLKYNEVIKNAGSI